MNYQKKICGGLLEAFSKPKKRESTPIKPSYRIIDCPTCNGDNDGYCLECKGVGKTAKDARDEDDFIQDLRN